MYYTILNILFQAYIALESIQMPLPVIRYIISERYGYSMYEEELFAKRLEQLRLEKNVSAREMSLSLGQNPSYINRIESGKSLT